MRTTILDTKDEIDMSIVVRNTRIIAEALGKHIFALNSGKIFSNQLVCLPCICFTCKKVFAVPSVEKK